MEIRIGGLRHGAWPLLAALFLSGCGASEMGRGGSAPVPGGGGARAAEARRGVVDATGSRSLTRIEQLLMARVAGVRVVYSTDGNMSVRIRGASSLTGGTEPLWVVDGHPVPEPAYQRLQDLDPADVERIYVLKDAASTGIYGARGMHGVIVVVTRRGP